MGVIFVAGIHGVGKTTCCAEAAKLISASHYTASGIIKSAKVSAISEHSKEVRNVKENQEYLIEGLKKIIDAGEQRIILDGHFTLLTTEGQIKPIATEVFAQLHMDGIVVYKDEPTRICGRLQERDGKAWDPALLAAHQDAELLHANDVSSVLRVPIICLDSFDSKGLVEAAAMVWR